MAVHSAGQRGRALHHFPLGIAFSLALLLSPLPIQASASPSPEVPASPPAFYTFTGDTIQIPSGSNQTDARAIIVQAPAQFHIAENASLRLTGTLANAPGSYHGLHKTGHGTLALANASTLLGNTLLYQGTLRLEHSQALGWAGRALQVSGGTRLEYADGLGIPHGLQLVDLSIPAGLPFDAPRPGAHPGVQWVVEQGRATHQGDLLGYLPIWKLGQGELVLDGMALAYQGEFHLGEGGLALNNMLGGSLLAEPGTRLSGQGRAQSLRLDGNVLFAPGLRQWPGSQSPASQLSDRSVFQVGGDVHLSDGSTLLIVARPDGMSNRLQAGGSAHLAGRLHILAEGAWERSVSYDIVQAQRIEPGTAFADWLLDRDDLDASLDYAADRVILTLSPRQEAVVWDVQASGTAVRAILLDDSRFVRQAVLHQQRGGLGLADAPRAWAHAFTVHGSRSGPTASGQRSLNGAILGMDVPINAVWHGSVYGGAQHTRWTSGDSQTPASVNTWHLGMALTARRDAWQFTTGLAYSRHSVSGHARLAQAAWRQSLHTSHRAHTVQLFASASRQWRIGDTALTPFLELAWISHKTPSHRYQASNAWLATGRTSDRMRTATLGVRAERQFALKQSGSLGVYAQAAWRHADTSEQPWMQWQGSTRGALQDGRMAPGVAIARHALQTQLGLTWQFRRQWQLSLDYAGQHAGGDNDHQWLAQAEYRF